MYKIEKRFSFPMGHRLSKHKGKCVSLHGHNFIVLVGVKSEILDSNDMVIDFGVLKGIVGDLLEIFDHCTLLNKSDEFEAEPMVAKGSNIIFIDKDPTSEVLSKILYEAIEKELPTNVSMDYVTVYENESSKSTYYLD